MLFLINDTVYIYLLHQLRLKFSSTKKPCVFFSETQEVTHPTRAPEANPRKPGASKQARFNVIFSMAQSIYLLNSDETSGSGYLEGEDIFFQMKSFDKQLLVKTFFASMMYILMMQFC